MAIFELAYHLKQSVDEVRSWSYDDFQKWFVYLEKRPVGWRDDDRTFKLLQAQGVKEKPESIFPSLKPIYKPAEQFNAQGVNMASLKHSALFTKMLGAKGGDVIGQD